MCRDTNKFLELLKPGYNDAVKYCRALCASWSPDDAEDVLQQALLKALESFDSLNDLSKFRSWFFKIITREFYTSIRKHFWKKFVPLDNIKTDIPEIYPRNEFNESRIILDKALSKLSAKERSAILLFEVGEFSIEEIRTIQKENSLSAVKSRLSRARQKLKRYITELESKNIAGTYDLSTEKSTDTSSKKFFTGNGSYSGSFSGSFSKSCSGSFQGDIENETIKLAAELKTKK
jgi:RNA polymerase sigma-70 factor (ECF subfamily)